MYQIGEEEIQAVARVIKSGQLSRYRGVENGECFQFERDLCERFGCKYALLVNSGTSALICSLVACGIGPGDEVIVPAYTFMATAAAVLAVGAVPVIAEIDETLTLDVEDSARKVSPRTKAIIPVYMHGLPCAMDRFSAVAADFGLRLIEDACQGMGALYQGRPAGAIGDIGAFSFNQFKIITSGEGGAIITNNRELYEKALIQHDGGCMFRPHADLLSVPIFPGANYRASEITGAILRVQLQRLDVLLSRLRERKRAAAEVLGGSTAYALAPIHGDDGDCGQVMMLQVDTEERMRRLLKALAMKGLMAGTPIDSTGHVYTHWKPVLQQQRANYAAAGAHQPSVFNDEDERRRCPRTISILSRTVGIPIDINEAVDQVRRRVERIRTVAESV